MSAFCVHAINLKFYFEKMLKNISVSRCAFLLYNIWSWHKMSADFPSSRVVCCITIQHSNVHTVCILLFKLFSLFSNKTTNYMFYFKSSAFLIVLYFSILCVRFSARWIVLKWNSRLLSFAETKYNICNTPTEKVTVIWDESLTLI